MVAFVPCSGAEGVAEPRFRYTGPEDCQAAMLFGGMYMLSKGIVVYSNYWGKTAQVFFIASLLLSFFHPSRFAIHAASEPPANIPSTTQMA